MGFTPWWSTGVGGGGRYRCPARLQAGDRHTEGGAGDVVESGPGEEADGVRVAAVFAADADRQLGIGGSAFRDRDLDQPADTLAIEGFERGHREDAGLEVAGEDRRLDIVTTE